MQSPILTQKRVPWQIDAWQKLLSATYRSVEEVANKISLDQSSQIDMMEADKLFQTRIPRRIVEKAEEGRWDDPLLRQFLPNPKELVDDQAFELDPLNEKESQPVPGVLHKYHARVLLVMTDVCAIHCRYCFRRHFPYGEHRLSHKEWQAVCDYIARDESVEEVILSGGDPLSLKTEVLQKRLAPILALPNIKRLRIHSRFPVVIPERIDDKLLAWLSTIPQEIILVVHVNHPKELDEHFHIAMTALRSNGVHLLNQSVLLRGVNDHVDTLVSLSKRLFENGVIPYYLHLLDKVKGASHFDLADEEAHNLYQGLLAQLPGYLVPKLVREVAGEQSKVMAI